jgi:hypothetical protein
MEENNHDNEFDAVIDNLKKQREEYHRLRKMADGLDIEKMLVDELSRNIHQEIISEILSMSNSETYGAKITKPKKRRR